MCTEEKDLKPRSAEQVRESSELGAGLKAKSFSPQIRKVSFMLTFFILSTRCETNFKNSFMQLQEPKQSFRSIAARRERTLLSEVLLLALLLFHFF